MVTLIMKNVCLIIGAGAGIGGNCAKVFAKMDIIHLWQEELIKRD